MNTIRNWATILLLSGIGIKTANAVTWQIPAGTKANFTIDGLMGINVNGTLAFSNSTIIFDPANPKTATLEATLSVATIETGIGKRDRHLKSRDFFDAGKYPVITFKSGSVAKSGNGYSVTGKLRIKAATQTVTIPFTFVQTGQTGTFKGSFNIRRTQYSIGTGKERGMGDEVRINLNIPVKKVQA
jgi:polyisoprenoid-binding protein YceI